MGKLHHKIAPFLFLFTIEEASGQDIWAVEMGTGAPYNISLPLVIHQEGEPALRITAQYESEASSVPIYWMWRIGLWSDSTAWEFEAVHHKIRLTNTTQEVTYFGISHGLNLLTVNRGWRIGNYILRTGVGLVLAHPENVVRGKKLSEDKGILGWGYYFSGVTAIFSVGKRGSVTKPLFAATGAMISASYARVPVHSGTADVYNVTVHAIFGMGILLQNQKR
jgi:hypothetical protein